MAKIGALPSRTMIDGLRGALDFYELNGQVIVRSWPRWKLPHRSPALQAQEQVFTYANKMSVTLSAQVIDSWKWLAEQSNMTWRDWLNRAYLAGTLAAPGKSPI